MRLFSWGVQYLRVAGIDHRGAMAPCLKAGTVVTRVCMFPIMDIEYTKL